MQIILTGRPRRLRPSVSSVDNKYQKDAMIKIITTRLLFGLALVSFGTSALAEDSEKIRITGEASLVTDYVFRGISQSDENPAIQGGIDARFPNRMYAGIFATNVKKLWGNVYSQVGDEENFEYDLYLGYNDDFSVKGHSVKYDIGLIRYGFDPDPDDLTWSEAYVGFGWGGFTTKVSTAISGAPMGEYIEAAYRGNFIDLFDYRVHIGHYFLNRTVRGFDEYTDMSAGISKSFGQISLGLTYFRNDRDGRARFGSPANDRIVLTVSAFFAPPGN